MAEEQNTCGECGGAAPVLEALGEALRLPYCPDCSESLAAREDELDRRRSLDAALALAGATPRLMLQSLDTFPADDEGRDALAAARGWMDDPIRNLWLTGPLGVGKTGLAWGVVRRVTENAVAEHWADAERGDRPRPVAMLLRWADLLDDLREAFAAETRARQSGEVPDPSRVLERAKAIPILALDDLGRERPTGWALERLAGLVEARYQRVYPTIVTSNYGSRELAARLAQDGKETEAERIVSRLIEGAVAFRFSGPSRRRAAA